MRLSNPIRLGFEDVRGLYLWMRHNLVAYEVLVGSVAGCLMDLEHPFADLGTQEVGTMWLDDPDDDEQPRAEPKRVFEHALPWIYVDRVRVEHMVIHNGELL